MNIAFDAGTLVPDIAERGDDTPHILEDDEFDLEWREILFPPADLPVVPVLRPDVFSELQQHEAGALTQRCPPLVLLAPAKFMILDGYHRIGVAQAQGAPLITMLAAKVAKIGPKVAD